MSTDLNEIWQTGTDTDLKEPYTPKESSGDSKLRIAKT